jgi:DNA modification methylase
MGLPIQSIEFQFDSLDNARIFVMKHVLNQPHLNPVQRMMLVRQLKDSLEKIARRHQGKRNDLLPSSKQTKDKFHTTKMMAVLANVGEQTFHRFNTVLEQGPTYLKKEKMEEFLDRLVAGTMSVNQAHNSLLDAIKAKKGSDDFADKHPEVYPKGKTADSNKGKPDGEEVVYENPSLTDDWHNKIVCGNRMDVLKQLPDACCNLVILSPEYNVPRIKYDIDVPVLPYYSFLEKLNLLWTECARILRVGGRLAINVPALVSVFEENSTRAFNTPLYIDIVNEIEKLNIGLNLREVLVWHKLFPIRKHHLSSPSPANPCYRADHEFWLIISKNGWVMTPENEDAPHDLTKDIYEEFCSSVMSFPPQSIGVGNHPAVYPETAAERIIRMHSFIGDTCVDPSNGSGTSTAVAALWGRRWFGCDLSPKYCKAAEKRTQKAYNEFLNGVTQTVDVTEAIEAEDKKVA